MNARCIISWYLMLISLSPNTHRAFTICSHAPKIMFLSMTDNRHSTGYSRDDNFLLVTLWLSFSMCL